MVLNLGLSESFRKDIKCSKSEEQEGWRWKRVRTGDLWAFMFKFWPKAGGSLGARSIPRPDGQKSFSEAILAASLTWAGQPGAVSGAKWGVRLIYTPEPHSAGRSVSLCCPVTPPGTKSTLCQI